ncbi:glutamine cyclotransferase [Fulvitalea axinellae]|uniref:Glutamine cyclotransferase n=1 Tax=Fulvitalea axinellae TaxID=1182444 RepID=A0AAU9DH04_9BACT|nr:glutamine cyclotransferase [Fulvitalea axinellae]
MMRTFNNFFKSGISKAIIVLLLAGLAACGAKTKKNENISSEPAQTLKPAPAFNADSAYAFIQKQVDFGPRIPNTPEHRQCRAYLASKLKQYGATVTEQNFEANTYDGTKLYLTNIIGKLFPERKKRILLSAHWDTRPFADKDKNEPMARFDGADDGGSGVGVILEIARILQANPETLNVGVDIVFFDGEDWGEPENYKGKRDYNQIFWCLGSQYWAKEAAASRYSAFYGINLDMVGAKDAKFLKEGTSSQFAPSILRKVWKTAKKLNYSHYFVNKKAFAVTDDHQFVNTIAKIPAIDIINYDGNDFGAYHHTVNDNMEIISKETLKAVGQTVTQVLYDEK